MPLMKRTLVFGDVHGCLTPLELLWGQIQPTPADRVVFLGDYVDRGPDSRGVVDFCLGLDPVLDAAFLSGNHEEKFFLANLHESDRLDWLANWGGAATLASYGDSLDDVPSEHWNFLGRCLPYVETESHVFVHANLEHDVPLDRQLPFTLVHKKFGTPLPHRSGKTMICGHTAQKTGVPRNLGHAVCIDTDPDRGGWLTCLHVETGEYWQANLKGESRRGLLA